MFKNRSLHIQIAELKSQLFRKKQVKDSLDKEMLVLVMDGSGLITDLNELFESELGYSKEQLMNKPLVDFIPKNARGTGHFKLLKKALEQKKSWVGAVQFLNVQGQQSWLRSIL